MKSFVAVLVIANLALAVWGLLLERQRGSTEATLLESQVNAAKIRIVNGESEPARRPGPKPASNGARSPPRSWPAHVQRSNRSRSAIG